MHTAFARVTENGKLYGNTYITWFDAPEVAQGAVPGHFVMLRTTDTMEAAAPLVPDDPLLPRPMSIHRLREGKNGPEWSILFDVVGRGTSWLASRQPGDTSLCWGPLGKGYSIRPTSQQLLLVAGGVGVAPLVWLAEEAVRDGKRVMLVLGGRTADQIFPATHLPPEVEVVVTTEDGSLGRQGLATDAFMDHLEWCDQAFACGPNAMFRTMADALRTAKHRRPVQVLLEERMGCGTAICYGCAVETRKGMKLVCKDGPRFDLHEVF